MFVCVEGGGESVTPGPASSPETRRAEQRARESQVQLLLGSSSSHTAKHTVSKGNELPLPSGRQTRIYQGQERNGLGVLASPEDLGSQRHSLKILREF